MKLRMKELDELFRNTIFSLLEATLLFTGIYSKEKVRNFVYTFTESSRWMTEDGRLTDVTRKQEEVRHSVCLQMLDWYLKTFLHPCLDVNQDFLAYRKIERCKFLKLKPKILSNLKGNFEQKLQMPIKPPPGLGTKTKYTNQNV